MSTRSLIGIEDGDGKCRSIYCHFDGYPEGVGTRLKENYKTREEVEALLGLGDLSSLGETLEKCDAYCRDEGEDMNPAKTWADRNELAENAWDYVCAEYVYLFVCGQWIVYACWRKDEGWKQLSPTANEVSAPAKRRTEIVNICALNKTLDFLRFDDAIKDLARKARSVNGLGPFFEYDGDYLTYCQFLAKFRSVEPFQSDVVLNYSAEERPNVFTFVCKEI